MPIDPNIALGYRGIEVPNPLAGAAQVAQIQNALQQQQLGGIQIQNALREQNRRKELEMLMSQFTPETPAAQQAAALQRKGFFGEARSLAQEAATMAKTQRETRAAELDAQVKQADIMGRLFNRESVTDQSSYDAARARAISLGLGTEAEIPTQYDPALVNRIQTASMSFKDTLAAKQRDLEVAARQTQAGAAASQAETAAAMLPIRERQAGAAVSQAETAAAMLPIRERQARAAEISAGAAQTRAGQEQLTASEREYAGAKARGEFQGSFVDWKRAMQPRQFEATTDVERARMLSDRAKSVSTAAESSAKLIPSIDVSQAILDKGFSTGWGTGVQKAAADVLASMGVAKASDFSTSATLFLAESRKVLMDRLLAQKGPQTENDAKRMDQTFVALGNTPDANRFMLDLSKAQAKRDIAKHDFYENWFRQNKSYEGAEVAWNEGQGGKSIFDAPELSKYRLSSAMPRPANEIVVGARTPTAPPASAPPPQQPAQALSPADQQALEWARSNPRDPRAAKILQHLGQ